MRRVFVKAPTSEVEEALLDYLREQDSSVELNSWRKAATDERPQSDQACLTVLIYVPGSRNKSVCLPCLDEVQSVLDSATSAQHVILVSSAAFYGAHHHNQGMLEEPKGAERRTKGSCCISEAWSDLEMQVRRRCHEQGIKLTVLRPSSVQAPGLPHNLTGHPGFRQVMGFNPVIQVLTLSELANAASCAVQASSEGTFNIAPADTCLLSEHIKSKSWLPNLPWSVRKSFSRCEEDADVLNFARYSWTVSGQHARDQLGFVAVRGSTEAVSRSQADGFGMSPSLIQWFGRFIFGFMEKYYWRIEVRGLEHIPQQGKAVLVGFHRGLMPFDGVMLVHLLAKYRQRIPRFVIHPSLIKFPFLASFMARLGGVVACQKNANRVLESDEILGIFPEGIRGAFSMYSDAYRVGSHWRDDFARFAIEHNAVVIPVALVGTADTFPILGRISWKWFAKNLEWPFFPLTPTFPLIPFPLPAKWHIQILAPIPPSEYGAVDTATKSEIVASLSGRVRNAIQSSVDEMLQTRPSLFYGSAFSTQPSVQPASHELSSLPPDRQVA